MPRIACIIAVALAWPAAAQEATPRPVPREDAAGTSVSETVASSKAEVAPANLATITLVPRARPENLPTVSPRQDAFETWLSRFRGRALVQGVSRATADAALEGLTYDTAVIARDRNQSEFTSTLWDYLDTAVSDTRVESGRAALGKYGRVLEAVESQYGVDKEVVAAIWGLESNYGTHRGSTNLIEALATLAFDGRRGSFFEAQLVAALKILDSGDTGRETLTGSWAGAMGHTQFIPTTYLVHAVDFTGDGKRDIWGENPADALASTAAYLARHGWVLDQPWGVEVALPQGFDFSLAKRDIKRLPSEWSALGVTAADGSAIPDHAEASIMVPAGSQGPAFMTFPNFQVIERYNAADAYVIAVGHLADRIAGGEPIEGEWPRGDRALSSVEREELQRRLTEAGFDTAGVDGRIGPLTVAAVRAYQRASGMVPDGFASLRVLEALREG
ncbi:lytic murein transglycosylase [Palleronia sp.]|uniref:lytic murein transglycosylase n=1 Tax=Palleronia sp. TaxID=1940284 RepID=UPI0035C8599C